ncbi:hypothetical protein [Aquimarina sediminis]|uniref:hypothetical protein n=1 Tax=Aquimarina sediminis TaxID=2070536 RepID=UPI000CA0611D|nr:hypothetical protein [Aquimarina sediminis]
MSREFKRLFEVRILHDYYLTEVDGTSFFKHNEEEKEEILLKKTERSIYDISEQFIIQPLENTKVKMNEYNMVISKTSLGFIIGVEVKTEDIVGARAYRPKLSIPEDVKLRFSIRPKIPFFKTITALSFKSSFPSIYYFTNKEKLELNEATAPVYQSLQLTNELQEHQNGMQYEMGALIDFGGTLREAILQTDGSDPSHWEDIENRRFVSDADRILLPHNFLYSLKQEDAVTEIVFVLEDESSTEIKTITKSSSGNPIETISVNFSKEDETDVNSSDISSGMYNLKITTNGGPEIVYSIYLNDELYDKNQLGIIDIRFDELDSPYSLLDADGYIKTRIAIPGDIKIPHPVYEIRFKNRKTYWRYHSDTVFTAGEITDTDEYLVPETITNKKLVSIVPKALTEAPVPFITTGTTLILPQPKPSSLRVDKRKMYSEVFINPSNRLLNN